MTQTIKTSILICAALLAILGGYALGFNQAQAMWENQIKTQLCK